MDHTASTSNYIPDLHDPAQSGKQRRQQRMKERKAREAAMHATEPTPTQYAAEARAELFAELGGGQSEEAATGMLFKSLACMFRASEVPVATKASQTMAGVLRKSSNGRGRNHRGVFQSFGAGVAPMPDIPEPAV